jgi:hypothetical protein
MAAETKADTAEPPTRPDVDTADPLTDRQRLDDAIAAEKMESARLDEHMKDRRSAAGSLDKKARADAEARYREIQDRISAQLALMGSEQSEETPTVASLGEELGGMSAALDKFSAQADDLEGNVRALIRLTRDGPGSEIGAWRGEITRRANGMQAASESVVSQANEMRSALARVRRMAEPRI